MILNSHSAEGFPQCGRGHARSKFTSEIWEWTYDCCFIDTELEKKTPLTKDASCYTSQFTYELNSSKIQIAQRPLCNNIAKLGLPNHVTQTQNQQIFIVHPILFQTTIGLISWKSKGTPPMRPPPLQVSHQLVGREGQDSFVPFLGGLAEDMRKTHLMMKTNSLKSIIDTKNGHGWKLKGDIFIPNHHVWDLYVGFSGVYNYHSMLRIHNIYIYKSKKYKTFQPPKRCHVCNC